MGLLFIIENRWKPRYFFLQRICTVFEKGREEGGNTRFRFINWIHMTKLEIKKVGLFLHVNI